MTTTPEIAATFKLLRILQQRAGDLDPQIEQHDGAATNTILVSIGHARIRIGVDLDAASVGMGNATYTTWRKGQSQYGPIETYLLPDHAAYNFDCWLCLQPLGNGQPVQLLIIGPEPEDFDAHDRGDPYQALAVYFHLACLHGHRRRFALPLRTTLPELAASRHCLELAAAP